MSEQHSTSKSRWIACRRKVHKFLETVDVSSQGLCLEELVSSSPDLNEIEEKVEWFDISSVAANESDKMAAETGFHANETFEATNSDVDGNALCGMGICELKEGCWKHVDDAEIDFQPSDSDSEDNDVSSARNIRQSLAHWACTHNVTHSALSDLLKILKLQGLDVPQTAASLLKTPRSVTVEQKSGGNYIYFGLAKSISTHLSTMSYDVQQNEKEIELHVNIDGLPLFKSSSLSVWPILCSFSNSTQLRSKPFPVALFCGLKKPSNLDFLLDFIEESKTLSRDGFVYNGTHVSVKIVCIICDAPAKAFVKGIVQFNGKYGCDRCIQKGEYSEGRMLFLHNDAPLRTDNSFRCQENAEHHKQRSPFCNLPLDMINDFPIDYLHLVNLGVTKRLRLAWICGPLKSRLSSSQINAISTNLLKLQGYMPKEFARRPRSLEYVKMWKATEFRQFLLYTGPIVLRKVVTEEYYVNFLSLSCGVSIPERWDIYRLERQG